MRYQAPGQCPVCSHELSVTKLSCPNCKTSIEGHFEPCLFCSLPKDEMYFLKIFIKCRGNIKDVEKEMGISYPTVKSKLNNLITSLGFHVSEPDTVADREEREKEREQILTDLSEGRISAKEASEKISRLKG